MAAKEASLTETKWIGRSLLLCQIIVGLLMEISNHLEVVVKHLVEITVLLTGLCQNHWQMKRNCAEIKSANEDGLVVLVFWVLSSSFKPRRERSSAQADYAAQTIS